MTEDIRHKLKERIWDVLSCTFITCTSCESMSDDPQYTCELCWCEGGHGDL